MIEDSIIVSPKRTFSLVIFIFQDWVRLYIKDSYFGNRSRDATKLFSFFPLLGECYATKGLVYIKRNVYIPTRVFMLISAEPLDFVLWRRERIQEKAAQTCLVYTVLYRAYKFHTSIELDFKWRRSSFFSLFKWYFVEAQPGMIFTLYIY